MEKRIFWNFVIIALSVALLTSLLIAAALYSFFDERIRRELELETEVAATALNMSVNGLEFLTMAADLSSESRYTWIASDGDVLFDELTDEAQMENHLNRLEIKDAFATGTGYSIRFSHTRGMQMSYFAKLLNDGSVIRLSSPRSGLWILLGHIGQVLCAITVVTLLLSLALARRLTKRIVHPINALDLDHPQRGDIYDELTPLISRMVNQRRQIDAHLIELSQKREEFIAITENMSEGLVLLGTRGIVLSANKSALRIFGVRAEDILGKHVLTLNRNFELRAAIERTWAGERASETMALGGRVYQALLSPVTEDEKVSGVVLLMLDITERLNAEKMRREFTANVSHELKTPLTSISGYAEILKGGLVKPEDIQAFAGRIVDESDRLITLIDDIIKLSQLDEGMVHSGEQRIDLYGVAGNVCERLSKRADEYNVSLEVRGASTYIMGAAGLIDEMIYNLVDNAIKYNRSGGHVTVSSAQEGERVLIAVEDNGIGIPAEAHAQVFERFFRVDKSHSKETGGTGLGLSIVKHGALFHNAQIELDSTVGAGTKITLIFQAAN